MTDNELRGVLFFSEKLPQITGYFVIRGEHFEIAGWKPSPTRAEIKARPLESERDDASGTSTHECDPA